MGGYEERKIAANQEPWKSVKTSTACLWSFLVSMAGGLLLVWWEHEHQATNSQLWMVPFGLIMFITPVIVWFAVLVSETCEAMEVLDTDKCQPIAHVNYTANKV